MRRWFVVLALVATALGCSKEKVAATKAKVAQKVHDAFDASAPLGRPDPNAAQTREQQRFDQQWRQLQSFAAARAQKEAQQQAAQQAAATAAINIQFVTGKKESFKNADPAAINSAPVNVPISGDVRGPSVLKAQVYLDRVSFSVGVIDGRWGRNSAISVWWWQRAHGIEPTGDVDEATFRALAQAAGAPPVVVPHQLSTDDVKGPFVQIRGDVYEQQSLQCLCYESLREKLAEMFHTTEDFLEVLNPDVKINELQAGQSINVPNVRPPLTEDRHDIARVVISIAGNSFNGFDANGGLIFHAPTTVGSAFDPSPNETVKVVKIIPNPHFHYDPTLYHEVPDSNPDAHLQPGPNSPVGIVWIALSKPHYGVHGTKDPESIGYVSSHGCIRLTNWDAADVMHRLSEGTPISFVDTSAKGLPDIAKKDQ
jgi:lipoprotein-anchoring transpeptidase ErfK/SrfK